MDSSTFYIGASDACWLERTEHPIFISHRRMKRYKHLPRALGAWALDSGGFSELSAFGEWRTSPAEYAAAVKRYSDECGGLRWAAIQDYMCEPTIRKQTGLTIGERLTRTVESYITLNTLAPGLPWAPVLQGWHLPDYLECADLYRRAGVDLGAAPIVGVGTLCRRQSTNEAQQILSVLHSGGLRLHGFGFKTLGLSRAAGVLASSDSFAWSYNARRNPPLRGCKHKSCANCMRWALDWRRRVCDVIDRAASSPAQMGLAI